MRLLIFLVLIRYGLACKCRIDSQFIIGCRISFSDIPRIAFSFFFSSQLVAISQMVCHKMS